MSDLILPNGFENLIAALEAAKRPFFCTGTLPLDADKSIAILIAEASGEKPPNFHAVYFPLKNEDDTQLLLESSHQASFGRGNQEVLDPSYRRALVLHKEDFVIYPNGSLEPHSLGILKSIAKTFLPSSFLTSKGNVPKDSGGEKGKVGFGETSITERDASDSESGDSEMEVDDYWDKTREKADDEKEIGIVAHLDKLNIYAQGDFFKEHVDTPRSPDMFGTLLINLPAKHEGGQLVVRAPMGVNSGARMERDEYTTNWGDDKNLEWIAFFSDCEHEVLPVISGNRVTISYTLSFDSTGKNDEPFDIQDLAGSKDLHRDDLYRELMAPSIFTENNPRLCFYMEHKYPMHGEDRADSITQKLKGRDATLYHALIRTGFLSVTFHHVLFDDPYGYEFQDVAADGETLTGELRVILPRKACPTQWETEDYSVTGIHEIIIGCGGRTPRALGILEVTKSDTKFVRVDYPACGNEVAVGTQYGSVCMVATRKGLNVDEPWT